MFGICSRVFLFAHGGELLPYCCLEWRLLVYNAVLNPNLEIHVIQKRNFLLCKFRLSPGVIMIKKKGIAFQVVLPTRINL